MWISSLVFLIETCTAFSPYCAKNVELNTIPSITTPSSWEVELLQVQMIIRHGARTPCNTGVCWQGYNTTWNCKVYEIMVSNIISLF